MMTPEDLAAVSACLAEPERTLTAPALVQRLSRDFYWYSPILRKLLDDKVADAVSQPVSTEEVRAILACCHARLIPVTARGAGTGNYGQAIPLHGGVVLDLARMDSFEITSEGVAVTGPGTRLGAIENAARPLGWELRCYPSTVIKASVGGFLGGGSGGIGSIAHGGLRDFGTVRAVEVVTMEAQPRVVLHEGEAVHEILHAWGTNGIITKVWLALTPAVEWAQAALAFDTFEAAFIFSQQIAVDPAWTKRLVTTFEWPIPSCFSPILHVTREGKSLVFVMIAADQLEGLKAASKEASAEVTLAAEYTGLRTTPLLSDYTWNHTTLWAIKQDAAFTYLQCGFSATDAPAQFAALRARFGTEILFHLEWMKTGVGEIIPGAIPLVRFTTEARLNEMIAFCRSIGVSVANPHSNHVEGGGRYRADNLQLLAKYKYDPQGLLNPGKMATFQAVEAGGFSMKTWIPRARQFASLTWKQVDALSRESLVILPTAAIEQHGHHLPLATDTLLNNLLLGRALEKLPLEASVYALPPICYGKSNEHIGFPGTLSVSSSTFMAVVRDLGSSLASAGFRRLCLFNTHGGNSSLVDVLARDLRADFGLRVFTLFGSAGAAFTGLGDQERAYGFHAGEVETALLLHAAPELVHTAEYTVNYIADLATPQLLKPENSSANFAWLTRDIAPSGVMGDPRPATAENGARWTEEAAVKIAAALEAMLVYENHFKPA